MSDYKVPPSVTAAEAFKLKEEYFADLMKDPRKRIEMALFMASHGDEGAMEAIIHLIQMGTWAEKHGIPALEKVRSEDFRPTPCPDEKPGISCGVYHQKSGPHAATAREALAALPKEKA